MAQLPWKGERKGTQEAETTQRLELGKKLREKTLGWGQSCWVVVRAWRGGLARWEARDAGRARLRVWADGRVWHTLFL